MPGISYHLDLETEAFKQGAAQSMDYINQLHGRIDKLRTAGSGGNGFLKSLSTTLFQLPQQVMALQGIMSTLALPMKLAASAESTAVAFRTLVGDVADADRILGKVREMGAKTPFEFPELAQSARMLVAFGEAADEVPEILRRIGDVSAGTGVAITELAEIYGKARTQGTLFAEDINQMTGRGIPAIRELANVMGVAEGQVKKLASEGKVGFNDLAKAFGNMTAPGGQFFGMMDQMSGTMEGKISTLKDNVNLILSGIGEGTNEALKPVLDSMISELGGMEGTGKKIGEAIGMGIDMGVQSIKDGSLIQLLKTGMTAAALTFTDAMIKGISWVVKYASAAATQLNPMASQKDKFTAATNADILERRGLDHPGLNNKKVTADKEEAQKQLQYELDVMKAKAVMRKDDRRVAAEQAQEDRQNTIENSRIEAERDRFIAGEQEKRDMKVKMQVLENAKRVGQTPEQLAKTRADLGLPPEPVTPPPPKPDPKPDPKPEPPPRPFDTLSMPTMDIRESGEEDRGRRTIKGAGYGGKKTPAFGFRKSPLKTPSPAELAAISARAEENQKKKQAAAAGEGAKAQQGDKSAAMEQLLRKMAADLEVIAKSAAAEGGL